MTKQTKSAVASCGKYIVAKKNSKYYRVFLKDLKCIKVRSKKTLPPVPAFEEVKLISKNDIILN